jgi:hypothetical protein
MITRVAQSDPFFREACSVGRPSRVHRRSSFSASANVQSPPFTLRSTKSPCYDGKQSQPSISGNLRRPNSPNCDLLAATGERASQIHDRPIKIYKLYNVNECARRRGRQRAAPEYIVERMHMHARLLPTGLTVHRYNATRVGSLV